jgi:hypothetical protein
MTMVVTDSSPWQSLLARPATTGRNATGSTDRLQQPAEHLPTVSTESRINAVGVQQTQAVGFTICSRKDAETRSARWRSVPTSWS